MNPRCTLHPDATETCLCCVNPFLSRDLHTPVTLALWQCRNGHQEIAAPFLPVNERGCKRCAFPLGFITSGVWVLK